MKKELEKELLFKRVVKWENDELTLEDGTVLSVEMTEHDCCAYAGGGFDKVVLDAVITAIEVGDVEEDISEDWNEKTCSIEIKLFHNQNVIALIEAQANDGNGGYYYSVASLIVKRNNKITNTIPIVSA